ncbi:uncharacterized protein PAC_10600 [Phialocephala subalpina]|uniref:Uncharacterized protein n=1 Tax=Phialocephala subalpina TaxID=576137 RepID=A0A1L7X6Q7_9HELO|nr:uncharacterized protein PAC_10600 [Phialocephala subalpina]
MPPTTFTQDDFVPLDELVQQLSNSCTAAASVFEDLSEDLAAIHRHLESLIKQANNPHSLLIQRCQDRRKDWLHILESLTYALCELQECVSTYYEIGPDIWLQADDAQRHLNNLRSEVMVGYDAVDTFVESLGLSPLGRKDFSLGQIEKLLVHAVREERAGGGDYGVLKTFNGGYGGGGFQRISKYLKTYGIDEEEITRHDARTKQLLIWVVENEPALTDILVREELAAEAEKQADEAEKAAQKEHEVLKFLEEFQEEAEKDETDVEVEKGEKGKEAENIYDAEESDKEAERKDAKSKTVENIQKSELSKQIEKAEQAGKSQKSRGPPPNYSEHLVDRFPDEDEEDMEMTTVLVERHRPSTSSRPSSVATSAPSLVEAEVESGGESEWELV